MATTLAKVYQVQAQVLHLFLVLLNICANATLAKFGAILSKLGSLSRKTRASILNKFGKYYPSSRSLKI
jgi:hypothetical protein